MLYNLYTWSHETWHVCIWTLLSIPVAAVMIAMAIGHGHNQKKRQKDFEKDLDRRFQ